MSGEQGRQAGGHLPLTPWVGSFLSYTTESSPSGELDVTAEAGSRRPTETGPFPDGACPKPRISGSGDPFMGCMECNFVLSLTKSNIDYGTIRLLFSEIIYIAGLRVACLIKRKPLA